MDPTGQMGAGLGFGALIGFPGTAGSEAGEYISSLDDDKKALLQKHDGEFQSKEEVERYLEDLIQ